MAATLKLGTFAYANALDGNWRSLVRGHQRALSTFKGKVSVHGVFQDICIHSSDNKIAKVSKQRILRNMDIAQSLSRQIRCFPRKLQPLRLRRTLQKQLDRKKRRFWSEVIEKYEVTVLLENFWEPSPEILSALLNEVDMPRLKVCLDTGHINAFSKVPFDEWIAKLNTQIPYMHFSDNMGKSRPAPGNRRGNINWQALTAALEKHKVNPEVALETETIKKTDESLDIPGKKQNLSLQQKLTLVFPEP